MFGQLDGANRDVGLLYVIYERLVYVMDVGGVLLNQAMQSAISSRSDTATYRILSGGTLRGTIY